MDEVVQSDEYGVVFRSFMTDMSNITRLSQLTEGPTKPRKPMALGNGFTMFLGDDELVSDEDEEDEELKKYILIQENLIFFAFCVAEFVFGANYSICVSFFPTKAKMHGINEFWIGSILGSIGLGALVSSLFYDWVLATFSRKSIWFWSNAIQSFFAVLFRFIFVLPLFLENHFLLILASIICCFFSGFSRIGISNLGRATTNIVFAGTRAPRRIGLLLSIYNLGLLLGPFIGEYFYKDFQTPMPFLSIAVVLMGNMLFSILAIPNYSPPKRRRFYLRNKDLFFEVRNFAGFLCLGMGSTVNRFMWSGVSLLLIEKYQKESADAGVYLGVSAIGTFLVGLFATSLMKCVDPRLLHFWLGLILPGIGCLLMSPCRLFSYILPQSIWVTVIGFLLVNVQNTVQMAMTNADITNNMRAVLEREPLKVTKDQISNQVSTVNLSSWLFGPLFYSLFTMAFSFTTWMTIFGGCLIVFALLYLVISKFVSANELVKPVIQPLIAVRRKSMNFRRKSRVISLSVSGDSKMPVL